jgi:hypothetical protein
MVIGHLPSEHFACAVLDWPRHPVPVGLSLGQLQFVVDHVCHGVGRVAISTWARSGHREPEW